jgi:TorA maturation chaperone TorD
MADHLGAELNFLAVVLQKAHSDPKKEQYYRDLIEGFLDEHVIKWIPQFARDMEDAADLLFYKTLARVTRSMIDLIERGQDE